ncbi:hypothetical protein ET418_17160 [Oryzomonas rubra]|uniref:Integrase catalytic domain-containing protein n=1 Tax=Oryzomonas rubra TaxID=2509454 RepID=A0A5A9X6X5_9BACT|nr:hypothetical protein ET418_17160 [Oryzomonas rubra]
MNRRINCYGNAVAESFFQLLKRERTKRKTYNNWEKVRWDIFDYIEYFTIRSSVAGMMATCHILCLKNAICQNLSVFMMLMGFNYTSGAYPLLQKDKDLAEHCPSALFCSQFPLSCLQYPMFFHCQAGKINQ